MNGIAKNVDIAFLFGAGAEVSFGLSGGLNFAKTVIGDNSADESNIRYMNDAIRDYYTRNVNIWYPKYKQYKFNFDQLFNAALKKKFMEIECPLPNKNEFNALIKEKSQLSKAKKEEIVDKYTSYMGVLDEKFHTLISPKYLGPNKFWGVVACYARAYLLITGEMIKLADKRKPIKSDYIKMLESPLEYYNKWKSIIPGKDTYYSVVKKYKESSDFAIVTTNYTPLCENITEINDIAYVNGRLNWFESPYELKVYDINELRDHNINGIVFPYVFIQSGVKPIIEERQINEYSKMISYFKKAKTIIVVGYRINADDNHINSFLRSAVCDGKKMIYFNHNNSLSEHQIYKRLRLKNQNSNIDVVEVNNDNCISKFEEVISKSLN